MLLTITHAKIIGNVSHFYTFILIFKIDNFQQRKRQRQKTLLAIKLSYQQFNSFQPHILYHLNWWHGITLSIHLSVIWLYAWTIYNPVIIRTIFSFYRKNESIVWFCMHFKEMVYCSGGVTEEWEQPKLDFN